MAKFKQAALEIILCIVNPNVADSSELSRVKGTAKNKLAYLKKIRDERMLQSLKSGVHMENICMRIPESIESIDVETVDYYRKCYQNFTNHLDSLNRKNQQIRQYHGRHAKSVQQTLICFQMNAYFATS